MYLYDKKIIYNPCYFLKRLNTKKFIVCWPGHGCKDVTRRSRERAKWQKEGENQRWGRRTEGRSRMTLRPGVYGLRCQWLKKNLEKKGNCYEDLLDSGDAKFLLHLPRIAKCPPEFTHLTLNRSVWWRDLFLFILCQTWVCKSSEYLTDR